MKSKCPVCGKICTTQFCDYCDKSIPDEYVIDDSASGLYKPKYQKADNKAAKETSINERDLLETLISRENEMLDMVGRIHRHTETINTIMIISVICSVISVIGTLIVAFF